MATDNESTADEFGEKIAQALRDKAAWRRLPRGGLRRTEPANQDREPANQDRVRGAEAANQGGVAASQFLS